MSTLKKNNQRVLFAHSSAAMGGAERVTLSTIDALKRHCEIIVLGPQGDLQRFVEKKDVSYKEWNFNQQSLNTLFTSTWYLYKTIVLLKTISPAVIHTGDILALRSLSLACKILRIPIICHVHFPYDVSFVRWVFSRSATVENFVYCSNELKKSLAPLLEKYVPLAKHVVIHNGIDVKSFSPSESEIINSVPRVGIIGNLQKRKGHEEFLDMALLLKNRGIIANYDIIGGDILQEPRQAFLEEKAVHLGISELTTFHGQVDDVKELLASLDVVVCASHEEAFPVALLEAMASGKAIVTTNVNGIPEAINESCGILCEPFDASALADGVQYLLENVEVKSSIQSAARKRVSKNFSKEHFQNEILRMYRDVNNYIN